jgi:predicted Zn-dependent protease with MMP-like domain
VKFEQLVETAVRVVDATQRRLPLEIRALARGIPVHYEKIPNAELITEGFESDILGLFTGSAHGDDLAQENPAPPQIVLYLENLWDFAEQDPDIFRDEVRLTYLHELGHYLGWDEDELAARGLD